MTSATNAPRKVPRWTHDAWRQALDELRLFFATSWHITRRPLRFSEEWSTGRRKALNPLGFLATSLAILGIVQEIVSSREALVEQPVWLQAVDFLAPYLYYGALGLAAHLLLRLQGSTVPLRGSLGIALYIGGGPLLGTELPTLAVLPLARKLHYWSHGTFSMAPLWFKLPLLAWFFGSFFAIQFLFLRSLIGLHGRSTARCLTALLTALVFVGLGAGMLSQKTPIYLRVPHLVILLWPKPFINVWF